jgi:hypothetical protein
VARQPFKHHRADNGGLPSSAFEKHHPGVWCDRVYHCQLSTPLYNTRDVEGLLNYDRLWIKKIIKSYYFRKKMIKRDA